MLGSLDYEGAVKMHLVPLQRVVILRIFNWHSFLGQEPNDPPLLVFNSYIHDFITKLVKVEILQEFLDLVNILLGVRLHVDNPSDGVNLVAIWILVLKKFPLGIDIRPLDHLVLGVHR